MSFDDDSRWDGVIANMNYLSLSGYTGNIKFQLVNGRVSRRTVDELHTAVTLMKEAQRQREVSHATA